MVHGRRGHLRVNLRPLFGVFGSPSATEQGGQRSHHSPHQQQPPWHPRRRCRRPLPALHHGRQRLQRWRQAFACAGCGWQCIWRRGRRWHGVLHLRRRRRPERVSLTPQQVVQPIAARSVANDHAAISVHLRMRRNCFWRRLVHHAHSMGLAARNHDGCGLSTHNGTAYRQSS